MYKISLFLFVSFISMHTVFSADHEMETQLMGNVDSYESSSLSDPYTTEPQVSISATIATFANQNNTEKLQQWLKTEREYGTQFQQSHLKTLMQFTRNRNDRLQRKVHEKQNVYEATIAKKHEIDALLKNMRQEKGISKKQETFTVQLNAIDTLNDLHAFVSDLCYITSEQKEQIETRVQEIFEQCNSNLSTSFNAIKSEQQELKGINTILNAESRKQLQARCCCPHNNHGGMCWCCDPTPVCHPQQSPADNCFAFPIRYGCYIPIMALWNVFCGYPCCPQCAYKNC